MYETRFMRRVLELAQLGMTNVTAARLAASSSKTAKSSAKHTTKSSRATILPPCRTPRGSACQREAQHL